MMIFSIFDNHGDFSRLLNCDEVDLCLNLQNDEKYVVGEYQDHYLVNNQPVEKPPRPSEYHEWDIIEKQWLLSEDAASRMLSDAKQIS